MGRILTLTINPTLDKSTSIDTVAAEIKMRCDAPDFDPGGGGINVSRAIKKLGGDSLAVYTSGGGTGQILQELLAEEGIHGRTIPIESYTRENLTVYERSSGLQYRFGMPGPELSEAEWRACLDAIVEEEADYIVASGSLAPGVPVDFYRQLAERTRDMNVRVIVDTSGDALETMIGTGVFLMKPNLRELQVLSGEEFEGEDQLRRTCQRLISEGMAEVLVVSMGSQGAALVTSERFVQMRPPVVPIRSKVGAGDSMVGGLTHALAQDRPLEDAVRYGIAAGSAAVMTPGTQLCRKADTEAIYKTVTIIA